MTEQFTTFIWQGRLCAISKEPGILLMSAVGDPDNWDICPAKPGKNSAVAIALTGENEPFIESIEIMNDNQLLIVGTDHSKWVLTGNPMDGGRFEGLYKVFDDADEPIYLPVPEKEKS